MKTLFASCLISFFTFSAQAGTQTDLQSLSDCALVTPIQSLCKINVEDLRPTQFAVGMIVVQQKVAKIKGKNEADYEKYLFKNPVPVVMGNGGQFYMTDKHHLARAIYESGNTVAVARVTKDLNTLSGDSFWTEMIAEGFFYNRDENDQVQLPSALPILVQNMPDDPYRSLSGAVRDQGGYTEVSVFYLEFLWAHFFHQLPVSDGVTLSDIAHDFNGTVTRALTIAHSPAAQAMPGFSSVPATNP